MALLLNILMVGQVRYPNTATKKRVTVKTSNILDIEPLEQDTGGEAKMNYVITKCLRY